jgi:hypothetical protein
VFRPVPISARDAEEMIASLATQKLLGPFRGEACRRPRGARARARRAVRCRCDRPDVASIDVNPLIIGADGAPVAVDALVEIGAAGADAQQAASRPRRPMSSSARSSSREACW